MDGCYSSYIVISKYIYFYYLFKIDCIVLLNLLFWNIEKPHFFIQLDGCSGIVSYFSFQLCPYLLFHNFIFPLSYFILTLPKYVLCIISAVVLTSSCDSFLALEAITITSVICKYLPYVSFQTIFSLFKAQIIFLLSYNFYV